jgi:pseudaminic acid cytidylyltransferase
MILLASSVGKLGIIIDMESSIDKCDPPLNMNSPIAVVPARGGSKRIPRKNIRLFNGKPMIGYAIRTLQESNLFEAIYVSTDDEEIASISESFGATVPFLRPASLSGDAVGTAPVIADFLNSLNISPSRLVCCTYATNPFLDSENLISAFKRITATPTADYACAIAKYDYPIQRSLHLDSSGLIQMVDPENLLRHSQSFDDRWHDAGQFYFAKCETWKSGKPMLMNTLGIEVEKWRCVDIDDEDDWKKAELLHKVNSSV